MKKKEFNTAIVNLVKKFSGTGVKAIRLGTRSVLPGYLAPTSQGLLWFRADYGDGSGIHTLFMRFTEPDKVKNKLEISRDFPNLNQYSFKWNYHSSEAADIVDQLENRLEYLKSFE